MHRIMFVCHGNICRSPMAEFAMRDLVMRSGRANEFRVASSATTREEIGNPVHPGTRRILAAHGIACVGKTARQLQRDEYKNWDLFIVMDDENLHDVQRILKKDDGGKIRKLMEFAEPMATGAQVAAARDVADPWYTGDFEATWNDIIAGCRGLLAHLD